MQDCLMRLSMTSLYFDFLVVRKHHRRLPEPAVICPVVHDNGGHSDGKTGDRENSNLAEIFVT